MDRDTIFWPVLAWLSLTVSLYAGLTVLRFAIRAGHDLAAMEARCSRNLQNQFEWPVLFLAIIVLIYVENAVSALQLWLAWVFVVGRVLHTAVHVLTPLVIVRGLVFTINWLCVLVMWAVFLSGRVFA